jgi:hypothetical protein
MLGDTHMPGQQPDFAIQGDRYETAAEHVLGGILNLISVPRQRDFGIDFYCSVRLKSGSAAQTTRDLFGLQVGGPGKIITYGGLREGKPRPYEIEWLKSLTIPIFYARVSGDRENVDLYSMSPVWRVLFQSPSAFEIRCEIEDPMTDLFTIQSEQPRPTDQGNAFGDGNVWRINLGPPLLSVTARNLQDTKFAEQATNLLRPWLKVDWTTVVRFHARIALADFMVSWRTNTLADAQLAQTMYWSPVRGANVRELVEALQPALINLGANLQWQDDIAAYSLIPMLEWVGQLGVLSPFGQGLLEGLRQTRDAGLSPAKMIDQQT